MVTVGIRRKIHSEEDYYNQETHFDRDVMLRVAYVLTLSHGCHVDYGYDDADDI